MFDMTKAESKKIIGKIYWINLHIPEAPGYFLIFREKDKADFYILKDNESIDSLKGNDSVLLIKAKDSSNAVYYEIAHDKGENIINVKKISGIEFSNYSNVLKTKYYFVVQGDEK